MWHRAAISAVLVFVLGWTTTLPLPADPAPYVPPQLRLNEELSANLNWAKALERVQAVHRAAVMHRSIERVLTHEGGYANESRDPGGPTRYGITRATARAFGYTGRMDALPLGVASIFYEKIWVLSGASAVADDELAFQVFDAYVQHGPRSIQWVQQATHAPTAAERCFRLIAFRERAYKQSKNWPIFKVGWMKRLDENRANCA